MICQPHKKKKLPVEAGTAGRFFDDLDITSGKGDGYAKTFKKKTINSFEFRQN